MTSKGRAILCAAMLAPTILLAACSNSGDAGDGATTNGGTTQGTGGGQQSVQRDATGDVKIDSCAVESGVAQVKATIKNSAEAAENYVIAVEVHKGDERVDGVALTASVPAGESQEVQMGGTKSDLEGDVTCKVTSVQTMGG